MTNHCSPKRGFTLIELLIVVAIMVVLAAFLLPAVRPALEERKVREAARMVNVFFTGAQARAIERGRPVGVWLERNPTSPDECIQVFLAEAPPPYSGDTISARMYIDADVNGYFAYPIDQATFNVMAASLPTLVRPGEQFEIKFDYQGPWYPATLVPGTTTVRFSPNNGRVPALSPKAQVNPPPAPPQPVGPGVAFQIQRQPTRSSATSFALPANTAINLYYSGASAIGFAQLATGGGGASSASDTSPILVTFNPSGRLERVTSQGVTVQATESLYFFVTRNDKVQANALPDVQGLQNLEEQSNMWVTVGHNTGAVLTVENANTLGMPTNNLADLQAKVAAARRFAREKTSMGGR